MNIGYYKNYYIEQYAVAKSLLISKDGQGPWLLCLGSYKIEDDKPHPLEKETGWYGWDHILCKELPKDKGLIAFLKLRS